MPGKVIWITGLSGSGKTVIAKETHRLLQERFPAVVFLDGDEVRALFGEQLGHDLKDRLENAYRIAQLAQWLSRQGLVVVVATMSLFPEIHEWNRKNMAQYLEVYVRVRLETVIKRDPHGHYAKALKGELKHVVGIDLPFQEPQKPDLVLDNDAERKEFADFARCIIAMANV